MKTRKQILASILFALLLSIPAFGGDMGGPSSVAGPGSVPTGTVPGVVTTPLTKQPGESNEPAYTVLAVDFLVSALSMY